MNLSQINQLIAEKTKYISDLTASTFAGAKNSLAQAQADLGVLQGLLTTIKSGGNVTTDMLPVVGATSVNYQGKFITGLKPGLNAGADGKIGTSDDIYVGNDGTIRLKGEGKDGFWGATTRTAGKDGVLGTFDDDVAGTDKLFHTADDTTIGAVFGKGDPTVQSQMILPPNAGPRAGVVSMPAAGGPNGVTQYVEYGGIAGGTQLPVDVAGNNLANKNQALQWDAKAEGLKAKWEEGQNNIALGKQEIQWDAKIEALSDTQTVVDNRPGTLNPNAVVVNNDIITLNAGEVQQLQENGVNAVVDTQAEVDAAAYLGFGPKFTEAASTTAVAKKGDTGLQDAHIVAAKKKLGIGGEDTPGGVSNDQFNLNNNSPIMTLTQPVSTVIPTTQNGWIAANAAAGSDFMNLTAETQVQATTRIESLTKQDEATNGAFSATYFQP